MADRRFLVVRLGSLGDIVHTFPAVAGLRASFPSAEIIWLTHPRWVHLVASSGLATEIWPVDSRELTSVRQTLRRIRATTWIAAIDYQGLWKSASLAFLGGVKKRIGFSSATIREFGVPILYTDRVPTHTTHIADQNGELTLRTGAPRAVSEITLHVEETDREACPKATRRTARRTLHRAESRRRLALEMLAPGTLRRIVPENPRGSRAAVRR